MKQTSSLDLGYLGFPGIEKFMLNALSLDRAGLQENFSVDGHENGLFHYNLLGRTIGSGSLHACTFEMILWDWFYPLGHLPEQEAPNLKKKGIGTLAQIESCLYVISLMGARANRFMIAHDGLSTERRRQLERIDIKQDVHCYGLTYDFAEVFPTYLQKWIDYANSKGFHFKNPLEVKSGRRQ